MAKHKGIMLDANFRLGVNPKRTNGFITGGLVIGNTIDQEAAITLKLNQGELKEDPLIGVGLTKYTRGKYNESQVNSRIRQHFTRAGIDYDDYKDRITQTIKTTE